MTWQPKTAQPVTSDTWQPKTAQIVAQTPKLNQDLGSQIGAGVLAFGQGAMPLFDEAGAAAGAALERLGSPWPAAVGVQNDSFGQIYDQRLANIRNTEKAFGAEHPILDPTLRVAGGVTGALATPGLAAASAARPVLTGTALGAAQGFTGAEGGAGSRAVGGGIGAGLGAGLAYVGKAIGDKLAGLGSGSVVRTPQGNVNVPIDGSGRALNEIKSRLQLGGVTPEEFAQRLASSSADDFAGEAGGANLSLYAQSLAKTPGVGMDAARTAMRQRIEQAHPRVNQIISDTIASPDDMAQRLAQIEGKQAFEGLFYDAAKDVRLPSDAFEGVLSTPPGQRALKSAAENLASLNVEPSQIGILKNIAQGLDTPMSDGSKVVPELPVSAWHEMVKSFKSQIPRDSLTGEITTREGQIADTVRGLMVSALRQASPEFDIAQTNSAAMRSSQEALDLGRKLARIATGDTGDAVLDAATKSATNLPYAQAGYSQGLRDVISGVPYGGNPASRLANPKVLERTAELVGNDKANSLYSKLLAEKLRMDFANRGINNSATAETMGQMIGSVSDIPLSGAELAKKGGNKLLNILNSGTDRRAASMLYATSPEEKAVLASLLMKSSTPTGFRGMKVLSKAERRAMAGLLTQTAPALPAQIGGALYNSGGQ